MSKILEKFKIELKVISPVHIGTGEVYEPTNFVIKNAKLIEFNLVKFVENLTTEEKKKLAEVCMQDDWMAVVKFIYRFRDKINGREVDICDGLKTHYNKVLSGDRGESSRFIIEKTASLPDGIPYIPGSSIKGALRTAYLSMLAVRKNKRNFRKAKELEEELLNGKFSTDPFRLVKIFCQYRMSEQKFYMPQTGRKERMKGQEALIRFLKL